MKKKIFTFFIFLALCSCKKQNEIGTLPIDKLYIIEYRYDWDYHEVYGEPCGFIFRVAGFCELDKDFNLQYARQVACNGHYYYNSESVVPDSMRNKISDVLSRYQTDTTFLYQGEPTRIYDGNTYRFIMQKHNQKDITIKFEPVYLPEDLKFVYSYLYENRAKLIHKSEYGGLFEMFKNQVKDDENEFELPISP